MIDPPITTAYTARTVDLTWTEPSVTNGVITTYNIYQNISLVLSLPGNTTQAQISEDITPYTVYIYRVEACTAAGCVMSADGEHTLTSQAGQYKTSHLSHFIVYKSAKPCLMTS